MDKLLTKAEAAERLSISLSTLDRIVQDGDLPAYRIRGQMRYKCADVDAYLLRCRVLVKPRVTRLRSPSRPTIKDTGYYPGMKVV